MIVASVCYQTGEKMVASLLPLLKMDISPSWLSFRVTPSFEAEHGGASSRALGGRVYALCLEDATDSPHDAVPVNNDCPIERCRVAHQAWRELAQGRPTNNREYRVSTGETASCL